MTTRPQFISLDTRDLAQIVDLAPARASDLPREQHALMSGYGGPEKARSCYYATSAVAPATYTLSERVPPGVTELDVEIAVAGNGTIVFTTSADAVGTNFRVSAVVYDGAPSPDVAVSLRSGGVVDSTNGPAGRALTVRASSSWSFDWVDIVMVLTPEVSDLTVYAIGFAPVHVPR